MGNATWDETLHSCALPAPGASVHVRRGVEGLGGKGANQAVVLARTGVPVTFVAAIGWDARGDAVAGVLAGEGLAGGLLRVRVATDWSVILVTDIENAVLTTREAALALTGEAVAAALAGARTGDLCLLQGNLSLETTRGAITAARARGMAVAFNPSPVDPGFAALFGDVDILFVNSDEAAAFGDAVASAGSVVRTLGAEGAVLDGTLHVPAVRAQVVDPTGAGDAFLGAALAVSREREWHIDQAALEAGARAAALVVGRAGAFGALPSREELAAFMSDR